MCHTLAARSIADGVDLVLHEGDERRHHDGDAIAYHGRQLVAETLTAAGRHDDKGVVAIEKTLYNSLLVAFELVKAKDFLQISMQILHRSQYFAQRRVMVYKDSQKK